ncbi:MAG TPA: hypothetical protein DCZ04_10890, partial [Syntrophorhabdus aromaticivorans]|nr:hypothetical protein [Syntrophorhabdus aromaticivorans]
YFIRRGGSIMYAELVMINLGPGMREAAEKVADALAPIYKTMSGYKGVMFFGDIEAGEYGSLSMWASKQDAEALAGAVKLRLIQVAGKIPKKGPSTRRIFKIYKIYQPKA